MFTGERQASRLRALYLRSVLRQNVSFLDNELSATYIVNCVSDDTLLVQEAISEKTGNFIRNVVQFVGGYLVGFTQSWKLAIAILPFTPLLILPGVFYGSAILKFENEKQATYSKAGNMAEQTIACIRTVYSLVAETKSLRAYSLALEETVASGLKQGLIKGLVLGSNGISFVLWAFMAWFGSVLVMHGEANGAEIITTGLALLNGGRALGFAMSNLGVFVEGRMAAWRMFHIIRRIPPIDVDKSDGKAMQSVQGHIRLEEVVYGYQTRADTPVLTSFTLDIPAGKTTALVGRSGSGKSTVISLLERFYDPSAGRILFDGVDIKELDLNWYRHQIGLVSQEPALFATTIRENILYGKEDASDDEVYRAAHTANAHSFIVRLPEGYDNLVGERGLKMSGGEKQRIALARAIIKEPRILLLDEPTSALDMKSETAVLAALEKARLGRTTLIVAHRISTIRNADAVAVLESGRIVETGRHEELMAVGKAYRALVSLETPRSALLGGEDAVHASPENAQSSHSAPIIAAQNGQDSVLYPSRRIRPSFFQLLSLATPEWKQGVLGLAGALGFGVVHPMYAFLLGCMVSVYYLNDHEEMRKRINLYCVIFPAMMAASFLVNLEQHCNLAAVGEHLSKRLREAMLAAILKFDVGWFDRDENSSSAVCTRLSYDANVVSLRVFRGYVTKESLIYTGWHVISPFLCLQIRALITDRISLLVQTGSAVIVSFTIGLVVNWRLGILMIGTQPLFVFCYYIKLVCLKGFTHKSAKAHTEASQLACEAISQHRTITAFCSQGRVLAMLQSRLDASVTDLKKRSHTAGLGLGVAHFVLYASWGLQFWYAGVLVSKRKISYQDVFKIFFVFLSTGRVVAEALGLTPDLAKGAASIDSVFGILCQKGKINANDPEATPPGKVTGEIEACNVFFAYPTRPDVVVLRGLNLHVPGGTSMALVGHSGSGKSTVVALIERFYDPLSGVVKIDGKDIKKLELYSLRRQIGLVSQEPCLFSATIHENIAYGRESECTEAEVIQASRIANAHNFISALPEGYKTHSGRKGIRLSGGQKQRIAIARAVLKSPQILLLDEATSALDLESEHLVQDALETMAGRTTLVIAHRLSTVRNCDCISVMHSGAVVEQGTHEELMSMSGTYFSLVHLQEAGCSGTKCS
ncbi:putative multidrug resistance protein [Selaginella moellendorffii]|uniref:putative multidrug resistance protein n=1 Tax=Selaginella moellendorffii TaxID=88036 RepID=UPI000D1C72ED|nr:putative multidrug resistance protein [Selaginella moellendorffii]|eukprot:XP_024540475.1 putative multidrug resistance protein [Selaginella moellendorffii]